MAEEILFRHLLRELRNDGRRPELVSEQYSFKGYDNGLAKTRNLKK